MNKTILLCLALTCLLSLVGCEQKTLGLDKMSHT